MVLLVLILVSVAIVALTIYLLQTHRPIPTIVVPMTELEASREADPKHLISEYSQTMDIRDDKYPGVVRCFDSATGALLGTMPAMDEKDVNRLVDLARKAQNTWKTTTWEQRRQVLWIMQKYIIEHQEEICRVDARDSGKPLVDALLGEIITTCEKISYVIKHGEAALARQYRPTSLMTIHKTAYVEFHPLGVIGVIAPWNYPFHNLFNHIISGIFAGNAVVIKVSEYTCWSSAYYMRIVWEALKAGGHNPDLVQVITGFGNAGAALVACPGVDKVLFTGSPQVGRLVMEGASKYLKPVVLELGGKDPMVICEDANIDELIPIVLRGTYQNSGQNCCGIERVVVHEKVYEEFLKKVVAKVKNFRQGPALSADVVDVAAMVTPQQIQIVQDLVDDAVHRGARLLAGGKRNMALPSGLFYEPTILADVTSDMRIAQEEVFGPVMSVFSFSKDEEAIAIVNNCNFGLGSCVFSKSDERGERIGSQFQCGMMCVNDFATNYLVQSLPFGGVKHSGFGRFAGPEGLQALCLQKSIVVDKVPFIRTTIPSIMQFPIQPASLSFGCSLVSLIYGLSLSQRLSAIMSLIRPK